ncbi:MAG: hypothetical protein KDA42_07920 [Planctomycetales bacterium]|nr:hypothetical protein [Planctomycetales bacterium]
MQTDLRWLASMSGSCFYAARAIIRGESIIHRQLAEAMRMPAHRLAAELQMNKIDRERFLEHVSALACNIENNDQLAETTLIKTLGKNNTDIHVAHALSGRFADLESAFHQACPTVIDELAVRAEPLQNQWEAHGPGLLHVLAQMTHASLIPERADVVLVIPILGGGGVADLPYNSVRMEAVLADPVAELPEYLRLAWLISQLNLDIPVFCERIPGRRVPRAAAFAMLPAVLAAAEEMGVAKLDQATVERALVAWHVEWTMLPEIAQMLLNWWNTYRAKRSRFSLALTALDRMLD